MAADVVDTVIEIENDGKARDLFGWRLEFLLSQKKMARWVGLNQSTWSNIESGASAPSITTRAKIVQALASKGVRRSQIIWPEVEKKPRKSKTWRDVKWSEDEE